MNNFYRFKKTLLPLACAASLSVPVPMAHAESSYSLANWGEDIKAARWETGTTVAGVTAIGLTSWNWGSSKSFRWNPEGWFGEQTGSGGADKLGHAFTVTIQPPTWHTASSRRAKA